MLPNYYLDAKPFKQSPSSLSRLLRCLTLTYGIPKFNSKQNTTPNPDPKPIPKRIH